MKKSRVEPRFDWETPLLLGGLAMGGMAAASLWRNRYSFFDRTVVITGGSRGLGLVLARKFAAQGAKLALIARNKLELIEAENELVRRGARVFVVAANLKDQNQVEEAMARIREHYGHIDVLINNAGIIQVGPLEQMTIQDFEDAMDIHFWGPVYTTMAALPWLRLVNGARIVNIASIGGKIAVPHMAPYTASKFALVGFSDACRAELRRENIMVTTVCPCPLRTGSPPHALYKGNHKKEYTWFHILDSLPLVSMNADRAARKIVAACRRGSSRLVLGVHAKLAVAANELMPEVSAQVSSILNRLLPKAPSFGGKQLHTGWESETAWTRSFLTHLSFRAAVENNECHHHH
jgi:NAD(P)-dependent dehydrogenase (short-subunit alcohol dehydrogenase family)